MKLIPSTLCFTSLLYGLLAFSNESTNSEYMDSGYFEEIDGMLVIEAEQYHKKFDRTPTNGSQKLEHAWTFKTEHAGFSGEGYVQNLPDEQCETCPTHGSPRDGSGPEMIYYVKINQAGSYFVHMRGRGLGGESNGVHIQVDGIFVPFSGGTNMSGFRPSTTWQWENGHKEYADEPILELTEGFHTLNVYGRDDGFALDKILLTTNARYGPSDKGPDSSTYLVSPPIDNILEGVMTSANWSRSPWFGTYYRGGDSWVVHLNLGWLYASGSNNNLRLYDFELGWLYTSSTSYPYLYSYNQKGWLWFLAPRSPQDTQWFYDFMKRDWISIAAENPWNDLSN